MKKLFALFSLIILLATSVYSLKIDSDIEDKLTKDEKVEVIVFLEDKPQLNAFGVQEDTPQVNEKKRGFSTIKGFSARVTKEEFEKLKKNKNVKAVFLDKLYKISLTESKPIINANTVITKQISNTNITGNGLAVCILDTGINYTHRDLGGCSINTFASRNCTKTIDGYDFINNDLDPYDLHGHGTEVAGIIAANGTSLYGVAPGAQIVSIKVCDDNGNCQASAILSGLDYCIQNKTLLNITAISISIGSDTLYSDYCDSNSSFTGSINTAIEKNITVIASSGNAGSTSGISDPACIKNVTSVGATYDYTGTYSGSCTDNSVVPDKVACFSNRNSITELLAPGSIINSTYHTGGYAQASGTSTSAPFVSGAVALLQHFKKLKTNLELKPTEILEALRAGGKNITDSSLTIPRLDILSALVTLDTTTPQVTITTIANNALYNITTIDLNYTVYEDINLSTCFYSLNGLANMTIPNCANTTIQPTLVNNTLRFYVNDSKGNLNETIINFDIDQVASTLVSPTNNATIIDNTADFTCTLQVTSIKRLINTTIYFNFSSNFIANQTKTITNSINTTTFSINNLPDGTFSWNCLAFGNATAKDNAFATSNYTINIQARPPVISSVTNSTIGTTGVTIYWTTDESSNSTVYYGTTTATTLSTPNTTTSIVHSVYISELTNSTTYYYNVTSCDNYGNCATSSQYSFKTLVPDTTKPTISSISVSEINSTTATVTWTTDESSNSTVHYGITNLTQLTKSNSTLSTSHIVRLINLVAASVYYYNISSCDLSYNCNSSIQYNFTTSNSTSSSQSSSSPGGSSGSSASGGGGPNDKSTNNTKNPTTNPGTPNSSTTNSGMSVSNTQKETESAKNNTLSTFKNLLGNTVKTFSTLTIFGMPINAIKKSISFLLDNKLTSIILTLVLLSIFGIYITRKNNYLENIRYKTKHEELINKYHAQELPNDLNDNMKREKL